MTMFSPVGPVSQGSSLNTLDASLTFADSLPSEETSDQRPDAALASLFAQGVAPGSCLTYIAQPAISPRGLDPQDGDDRHLDFSFAYRCLEAQHKTHTPEGLKSLEEFCDSDAQSLNFLSCFDAYRSLQDTAHILAISHGVLAIRQLLSLFEREKDVIMTNCWTNDYQKTINQCTVLNYYSRLLLYRARMQG
jgi:hypothetical protein